MPTQLATTWVSENVVAPRQWACAGQYGYEPILHHVSESIPTQMFGCTDAANPQVPLDATDLEVLLKNLAAERYED
jgi:hypothetical protein